MTVQQTSQNTFKAGYVAIVGEPNVGKSTLMNALLGQKISIVTSKPQTTRYKILGILSTENSQIIFLDTPGLLRPKYALHEAMMASAESSLGDADLVLFMIDATDAKVLQNSESSVAFEYLARVRKPTYLIINKVDAVKKPALLPLMDAMAKLDRFQEIFPISALNGDGLPDLTRTIVEALPSHPPYFPIESVSDQPEKFFVSEIIREKIFEQFKDEIPYATAVDIREFAEKEGRKDFISADVYVERDSQKSILIGKGGTALKRVGQEARKEIEEFLQRPVFLELHVKVRAKWRKSSMWLKTFGYGK